MTKVKCYSVRLESLNSISEKAYKATAFDGSTAIIPKSQVFGKDYDVYKSDAYWISAWILEQKELQYSTKKISFFDKHKSDYKPETGIEIERHIPEPIEPTETEPLPELKKEDWLAIHIDNLSSLINKTIMWKAPAYKHNLPYEGIAKIIDIKETERNPIVSKTVSGDSLEFAFIDNTTDGLLAYSDSDRFVTFIVIDHATA